MKHSWIHISIFYNINKWHLLIKDCINPLIDSFLQVNEVNHYLIALNKTSGEHIQLSLECATSKLKRVLDHTNLAINAYLKEYPSRNKKKPMFQGLFQEYKNNAICYNLYQVKKTDKFELNIRHVISNALIENFKNEEIKHESVLLFLIQFQTHLLCVGIDFFSETQISLLQVSNYLSSRFKSDVDESFKGSSILKTFEENRVVISTIYKRFFYENKGEEPDWLINWLIFLNKLQSGYEFPKFFNDVSNMLYGQLGINYSEQPYNSSALINLILQ